MFYSDAILSRRGPLGKVWLAAHMEKKLSKTQTLQTDIEQSVDAIIGQEVEVMALRLSGQLLLGVVRIYSRKAKYLLDDCNEALLKIKMAFRPGVVDMTEDQLVVNSNAITLQRNDIDINIWNPDLNWDIGLEDRLPLTQGQHIANMEDITLNVPIGLDIGLGDDTFNYDLGPADGIGSQDFDLGLDWGDEARARSELGDDMSVEIGLEAPERRQSIVSDLFGRGGMDVDLLSQKSKSRAPSEHPFEDGFGGDLGGLDLGDLGIGFGDEPILGAPAEGEKTPGQTHSPSHASSPLTEAPQTPQPEEPLPVEPVKAKRKPKEKKQIIDTVTELKDGPGAKVGRGRNGGLGAAMARDVSDIIKEPQFLPRSTLVARLTDIRRDPLAHFIPTVTTNEGTFLSLAPPGLPPQLQEMFLQPIEHVPPPKRRARSPKGSSKRARLDEEEEELEEGRRAESRAPSVALGSDALGRGEGLQFDDQTLGVDDFQMEVDLGPMPEMGGLPEQRERSKSVLSDLTRLSTPGVEARFEEPEESYADAACPIVVFDPQPTHGESREPPVDSEGKGYSKNTIKALSIIRKELQPAQGEEDERKLSFKKMSDKASRRAASAFFFELLVLGTRDCIQVSQPEPFEDIEVRAKYKLWERQYHSQEDTSSRAPSVLATPRRSGAMGPPSSAARSVGSVLGL